MDSLKLGLKMLRRNASAGELRVLLLGLVIAVASVTTVGFFADRVQSALDRQANELLGGDLVVIADRPMPPSFREAASAQQLAIAETRTFPSMVSAAGNANLAEVKAVTTAYPLRGRIKIRRADGVDREVNGGPAPGNAWVGTALATRLNLKVGDPVKVGRIELKLDAVIAREPDSVLDYFGIAPRLLMSESDLDATGLITVGARVGYRLLVSGESGAVDRFRAAVTAQLSRGQRVEGVRDSRAEVRTALERAQRFLGLASLLSVILASVAVALAARRFSQRQVDAAAMMRCLGATQARIFALHAWQFVMLGIAACLIGGLLGLVAQAVLAYWLASFFTVALPLPGPIPALRGVVIGFVLLLGFTLPPLLKLRNASTMRVLRRDLPTAEPMSVAAFALGVVAIAGLIVWQAGDLKLGLIAVGGFAAAMLVASLVGWALIRLVARLRGAASGPWRYGLANLRRRTGASLVQIIALGLGLMAMLMLTIVRSELLERWKQSMPADMPNRFAINIQDDQLAGMRDYFGTLKLATPDLYPMVRGRLVAIRGQAIKGADFADERAKRLAEREFNLSWFDTPRTDNRIVSGQFWQANSDAREFSVEEGIAKSLKVKVGDTLAYEVAGSRFEAPVTSIRKVDWDSFKPNFFVIASPALLKGYPASWITSFHLDDGHDDVVNGLVQRFPNVSVIDLSAIMAQVKRITDQVSRAVEFVFLFTLAAGVVVLFAAITATQDERIFEGAILRTLGASRKQLAILQLAEFLAIGILSGLVAAGGSVALAMVLSERVLGVPYEFHWLLPVAGCVIGGVGVAIAGLIGTRRAVSSPPLQTIRALG